MRVAERSRTWPTHTASRLLRKSAIEKEDRKGGKRERLWDEEKKEERERREENQTFTFFRSTLR